MAMIDTVTALASKRNPDKKRNQSLSHHELLEVFNIHDNASNTIKKEHALHAIQRNQHHQLPN